MKIKDSDLFLLVYNSYLIGKIGLTVGEKIVFLLVVALMGESETVTRFDVLRTNKGNKNTTASNLRSLILKGYLSASRSNQYFSRSYLSLTEKGLLLKAHIKKTLLQGLK